MPYVTTYYPRDGATGQLLFTGQGYLLPVGSTSPGVAPNIGETNYLRNGQTGEILYDINGYPQFDGDWFWNDGGVLAFTSADEAEGWPASAAGLHAGAFWNNGLTIAVVPGITPNPKALSVYYGSISASALLGLGGGNLPIGPQATGSGILYNLGGMVGIS